MCRYIAKDIIAGWPFWGLIIFFQVFMSVSLAQANLAFLAVNVGCGFLLALVNPLLDEMSGFEPFLCALPGRRRTAVLARYAVAGIQLMLCMAIYFVMGWALNAGIPHMSIQTRRLISPAGGMAFLVPALLLVLIFLPLYFRWGVGRAVLGMPAVLIGIAAVTGLGWQLFSSLMGPAWPPAPRMGPHLIQAPDRILVDISVHLGPAGMLMATIGIMGAVYLSFRLSASFHARRDL